MPRREGAKNWAICHLCALAPLRDLLAGDGGECYAEMLPTGLRKLGMSHLHRILDGATRGTLFGLVVGNGFAGAVLLLSLPHEYPMDRWYNGIRIFALVVGSSTVIGLVAGVASRVSEHSLSFLRSTMIVATDGVVGLVVAIVLAAGKSSMFLVVPLSGVIIGGIVVVMNGIVTTNAARRAKQEIENTADKP
jgi:hypothetical protein